MIFLLIAGFPDSIIQFRGSLIDRLVVSGLTVHVAAPDLPPTSAVRRQLEARGVVVHDIPLRRTGMNPATDLGTLVHLWRLMRRIRPVYVMGYTIKPVIYGLMAARLAGVPRRYALITGLGYAFQDTGSQTPRQGALKHIAQRLYAAALRFAEKTFFQNPDDLRLFHDLRILSPHAPAVVVNGSGVNIADYRPDELPAAPRFLLIARLLGDKGVREYVTAAAQLRERHPSAQFTLVGWIDENPDAIAQTELDKWISDGTIQYLGRLSDVRPAIADASVYVLPSYREGTPRTVLEAMAMGRAIITTDAPGCRETVIHGENGYLVPVKSVPALAKAMLAFIENPSLAISMGARSRQIAEDKYDVHKVNSVMLHEMGIAGGSSVVVPSAARCAVSRAFSKQD